jgi:chromosome partitioning protein
MTKRGVQHAGRHCLYLPHRCLNAASKRLIREHPLAELRSYTSSMRVIAFFNHKGGVGKTTLLFNVALALHELGHSVALFDADAQANLTGLALTEEAYDHALDTDATIWATVAPLVTGAGDFQPRPPVEIRDRVWVVPGDIRLSNFEAILPVGWTEALAGEARGFRVTSALHRLFAATADATDADYALIDLGPNVGALNRSALIAAHGVVIPLAPDLFSVMALPSVGNSMRDWQRQWRTAITNQPDGLDFALPSGDARPLGYVSQQFSVYGSRPAAAYRDWLGRIAEAYREGVLSPLGLTSRDGADQLGALRNFGTLVPTAQHAHKAIFELSGNEARGAQYTRAQESRDLFQEIATRVTSQLK